ncbi:MAG: metal ABC transporter permease [Candidatus Latescibacteria bacterium]|nr:metal ABC transporter permease [Candidatus Latescibacterota bacterium]
MHDFLFFMAAPFAACLVLVGIHAYLGIHVLARGVIFVDLALAQIAALGRTLAFLAGYELDSPEAYLISLAAAFIGAAVFSLTRLHDRRVPQEAVIGIAYAVAAAAGVLAIDRAPHGAEHLKDLLVGSILWVTWPEVLKITALYALIGGVHWFFRERFLLISLDEDEAVRRGWSVRFWDFIFYASFGMVITSSVQVAGVLLVFSFLIVPAVCGTLLAQRLSRRLAVGWGVGFAASALGCSLSYAADLPTGATVVCTFGAVLVALGLGWKGWHLLKKEHNN